MPPPPLPRPLPLLPLLLPLLLVGWPRSAAGRGLASAPAPAPADNSLRGPGNDTFAPAVLPAYLQVCRRSDPDLDECVRASVEKLRPHLGKGIPELGVPACEPLRVPSLALDQGRGPVSVRSEYSDVLLWGASRFRLRTVRLDVPRGRVRFRLRFPALKLRCRYRLDGRILMLPIHGSGDAHGNYTNVEATVSLQGEERERGGRIFLFVRSLRVDLNIGHASVRLENLFDGDPELGDAMNLFLNDNWRNVASEMQPALEQAVADLCLEFARGVFDRFPLEQLLPP